MLSLRAAPRLASLLLLLPGCGAILGVEDEYQIAPQGSAGEAGSGAPLCTPGKEFSCTCSDGVSKGRQICLEGGADFGPCFGCQGDPGGASGISGQSGASGAGQGGSSGAGQGGAGQGGAGTGGAGQGGAGQGGAGQGGAGQGGAGQGGAGQGGAGQGGAGQGGAGQAGSGQGGGGAGEAQGGAGNGNPAGQPCKEGEFACFNNTLLACKTSTLTFAALDTCADSQICDASVGACSACKAGSVLGCENEKTLLICSKDGALKLPQPCPLNTPLCVGQGECVASGAGGAGAGGAAAGAGGAGEGGAGQGGAGQGGAGQGGAGTGGAGQGGAGQGGAGQGGACDDGVKNGSETDVDCGGLCSQKCAADGACQQDSDCQTGACEVGVCVESCFVRKDASPVAGPRLKLKQFLGNVVSPIHPLAISPNGKFALTAQWGGNTRVYNRDPSGLLLLLNTYLYPSTELGSRGAGYTSDSHAFITQDCCDKERVYSVAVAPDGSLPLGATPITPELQSNEIREVFRVTPSVSLLTSGKGIRKAVNGQYDPALVLTGSEIWRLNRMGNWLYWTEGFSQTANPLPSRLSRARVDCNGALSSIQHLDLSNTGMAVAACQSTGRLYTAAVDIKNPSFSGILRVIDTHDCPGDLGSCKVKTTISRAEVPSLYSQPNMLALSPDCSALYVASFEDLSPNPSQGVLNVFSLSDPDNPKLEQTFKAGGTYDGVTLAGSGAPWALTATREAVYWTQVFSTGIAVFWPTP